MTAQVLQPHLTSAKYLNVKQKMQNTPHNLIKMCSIRDWASHCKQFTLLFLVVLLSCPSVSPKFQSSKKSWKIAHNLNAKMCHGLLPGEVWGLLQVPSWRLAAVNTPTDISEKSARDLSLTIKRNAKIQNKDVTPDVFLLHKDDSYYLIWRHWLVASWALSSCSEIMMQCTMLGQRSWKH